MELKHLVKEKKELFVLRNITNNYNLKLYYKKYCLILTKVIRNAKNYTTIILFSDPKTK